MTRTKRLDIRDLPRDPDYSQGQLRTELLKMANYVRKFPKKAAALVPLLETVLSHVQMNIEVDAGTYAAPQVKEKSVLERLVELRAGVQEIAAKETVVANAAKVGLELSMKDTREEMNIALIAKYDEVIKTQEGK